MRWGVGKGKFRNLTAIFLCFLLAGMFYAVWSFFQSIKPLTIDTSPLASTASVAERLINTNNADTTAELNASDIELFATIADSVNSIVSAELITEQRAKKKFEDEDVLRILISLQEQVRKKIGFMLNETYTSAAHFRNTEQKVLARILANPHETNEYPLIKRMRAHPAVKLAHTSVEEHVHNTQLTKKEIELIDEFSPEIKNSVFPFEIGLSSDSVKYIEYKQGIQTGVKP